MTIRLLAILLAVCVGVSGCTKHFGKQRKPARVAHVAKAKPASRAFLRGTVGQPVVRKVAHKPRSVVPAVAPAPSPYRLDSGDRLRIVVFGQENLSRSYSVDGGGFISMPLIGAVRARGITTFQLEDTIAAQLKTKYVKDPKVTVEIQTYRPFFILGEVRRPGQFPYVNGMTVQTAVAIAGGYTERAREKKVKLTRRINGRSVTMKVPDGYHVRPGDTIYIMERMF